MGTHLVLFPDMCHGCGGCQRICPTGALRKGSRILGTLERGTTGSGIQCLTGRLRIGEAMSPPLMKQARRIMIDLAEAEGLDVLIDAPPGVSCPAMTAVQDADVILLVTEPTPFGLHDLRLAWKAFRPLGKPMVVVINRAGIGDGGVQAFCRELALPTLAEIPFRRDIAEDYARGGVAARLDCGIEAIFTGLARRLQALPWVREGAPHA
jgi:MinD superfamily P-loop ATPase